MKVPEVVSSPDEPAFFALRAVEELELDGALVGLDDEPSPVNLAKAAWQEGLFDELWEGHEARNA
ncbi:MAG: hypothetical protein GEV08_01910 [Acidimicrobiia bacterium]|nr:hypothetical protein [Acidimicrobiia bacterium]